MPLFFPGGAAPRRVLKKDLSPLSVMHLILFDAAPLNCCRLVKGIAFFRRLFPAAAPPYVRWGCAPPAREFTQLISRLCRAFPWWGCAPPGIEEGSISSFGDAFDFV
jgi:hypothetical protein